MTYQHQLEILREYREAARSLDQALMALRDVKTDEPRVLKKRTLAWSKTVGDNKLVGVPLFGLTAGCPIELTETFSRVLMLWQLEKPIDESDVIVEFGSGSGALAAVIARIYPDKKVIGTDIEQSAIECIDELAAIGALPNLTSNKLDLLSPNLSFIAHDARVLFVSHSVLPMLKDGAAAILAAMLAIPKCRACLFEPISDQLVASGLINESLIPADLAAVRGLVFPTWETIKNSGFKIERVLPDFSGDAPHYADSLIELSSGS